MKQIEEESREESDEEEEVEGYEPIISKRKYTNKHLIKFISFN